MWIKELVVFYGKIDIMLVEWLFSILVFCTTLCSLFPSDRYIRVLILQNFTF